MSDALATLFAEVCPTVSYTRLGPGPATLPGSEPLRVHVLLGSGAVYVTGGETVTVDLDDSTIVVTGGYDVGGSVCDRVLSGVPELVGADDDPHTVALATLLSAEIDSGRAGHHAVVVRLLDLLAVTTIRAWLERNPDTTVSWASAHTDPVVGPALSLIHDQPGAAWTVDLLARRVGSSRSALSRRFAAVLGESPMSYVTCWRMCLSADLLTKTELPIDAVARRVGYANAYAFSTAFHRYHGIRPGRYRRAAA